MTDREGAKRQLRLVQWRADLAVRELFEAASEEISAAVMNAATSPSPLEPSILTPEGRVKAMREVDRILDTIYGTRKGAISPVQRIVQAHTVSARERVFRQAAQDMLDRLPSVLQNHVKESARE